MTSRITRRLIIYFLLIILLFTVISGLLFINLGRRGIHDSAVSHAQERGERIATFIANILEANEDEEERPRRGRNPGGNSGGNQGGNPGGQRGQMNNAPSRNYIKWMNDLLDTDIRLVSRDNNEIVSAIDREIVEFSALSDLERSMVDQAFQGTLATSNQEANDSIIYVAAPIEMNNEIVSVVLFEEDNNVQTEFLQSSLTIFLISMLVGSVLVAVLAVFFANRFISPLKKLSKTTEKLIEGNYVVNSNVNQKDEIGDLATNIDLLATRLEVARIQTEENNQMRDDLISNMSHELKTPVTVVKSSLEALKDGVVTDPQEVEDYHRILYKEMGFLEKLISDLMELNILRNSRLKMEKEELNLIDVLGDAVRGQALYAREEGVVIERDCEDTYAPFYGDYSKLRQLFITIINNGIKYGQEVGKVNIVEINKDHAYQISISNVGPTIDDETLDHLFQPFYRDKNTKEKGFGLGLAIAKEIADNHGISISVTSNNNLTTFTLDFPKSEPEENL